MGPDMITAIIAVMVVIGRSSSSPSSSAWSSWTRANAFHEACLSGRIREPLPSWSEALWPLAESVEATLSSPAVLLAHQSLSYRTWTSPYARGARIR